MLKKIALTTLFAITFTAGVGLANAGTVRATAPVPHALCPMGTCR